MTLMADAFSAKASTGILLPLLIFADIMAVSYYNRHANWKLLLRFLPWMVVGVIFGAYLGKDLPEDIFKKGMALIILASVVIMFAWERYDKSNIPEKMWFAGSMGLTAGFTTMIGNLAGPFANLFFLATRLPKNEFIGTSAWVFFIVNNFKVPFHIFSWETITWDTFKTDLTLVPFVAIGFFVGVKLLSFFSEQFFRQFILIVTAIGAILIFIK